MASQTQAATTTVGQSDSQEHQFNRQPRQRPARGSSLQKYKRVEKPREATPDDEIRVMGSGRVPRYVQYAAKLLEEMERNSLTIRATGKAVAIAVSVCEVIKRRFKGLHQLTTIGWTEIADEYEPLEQGLEKRIEKRTVPSISVFLTRDESKVDKKASGYQPPLDESLVHEHDPAAFANVGQRPPRRASRRQRPRPRGAQPNDQGKNKTQGTEQNGDGQGRNDARRGGRRQRKPNRRPPPQKDQLPAGQQQSQLQQTAATPVVKV